jgi:hypothetical protein
VTPRTITTLGARLERAAGLGDYRVPDELLDASRAAVAGEVVLDWDMSLSETRTFAP